MRSLDFSGQIAGMNLKPEFDSGCTTVTFWGPLALPLLTISLLCTPTLANRAQGTLASIRRLMSSSEGRRMGLQTDYNLFTLKPQQQAT